MRLRPYRKSDFKHIKNWAPDKRTHSLWCADRIPYPLSETTFHQALEQSENDHNGCAYTFSTQDGTPVGFLVFSVNEQTDSGYISYVLLDPKLRGQGYGTEMIKLLLQYAYTIAGVSSVKLSVYDVNTGAKRCYEKAGFREAAFFPDAFTYTFKEHGQYKSENWGRHLYKADPSPARAL